MLSARIIIKTRTFAEITMVTISIWKFYNPFASANRTTYIDSFLDRRVNVVTFKRQLAEALEHKETKMKAG
jgi:Domain of unknown function, B. Theta Gene description (DUF3871)